MNRFDDPEDPYEHYFPIHNDFNVERLSHCIKIKLGMEIHSDDTKFLDKLNKFLVLLKIIPDKYLYRFYWYDWDNSIKSYIPIGGHPNRCIIIGIAHYINPGDVFITFVDPLYPNEFDEFDYHEVVNKLLGYHNFIDTLDRFINELEMRNKNYK